MGEPGIRGHKARAKQREVPGLSWAAALRPSSPPGICLQEDKSVAYLFYATPPEGICTIYSEFGVELAKSMKMKQIKKQGCA